MNKNTFTTVTLNKGEMNVYDFGGIKLHAYRTNDFIDDEVFIVEKMGKAVVIESPCFFENIWELTDYLKNLQVEGVLVAYHGAGATFLPDVPKYATQNAVDYSKNGGGKALEIAGAEGDRQDGCWPLGLDGHGALLSPREGLPGLTKSSLLYHPSGKNARH